MTKIPSFQELHFMVSQISGKVAFPDLVEGTTGFKVEKLDPGNNPDDLVLFNELEKAARNFIRYIDRTRTRYHGERPNDVGKQFEEVFVEELKKTTLEPTQLKQSGYPDMKVVDASGRVTYLESKVVSKNWTNSLRSFYYSTGTKIDSDARHLVIAWEIQEEREKYWKVAGYKLCDLYGLSNIKVKLEYNSSNNVLYTDEMIVSSFNL